MRETAIQLTVFLLVHFWGRGISYNVGWKESEGEKKGVRERDRERERERGGGGGGGGERDREDRYKYLVGIPHYMHMSTHSDIPLMLPSILPFSLP